MKRIITTAAALALVGGVAAAAPAHASDQRDGCPWRFTTVAPALTIGAKGYDATPWRGKGWLAPADADARPGSYSITLGGSRRGYSSTPADRITDR